MSSLKKITAFVLAAVVVSQLTVFRASAVSALTGYSGDRNNVRIDITSGSAEGSDFAEAFPGKLYLRESTLGESTLENPLKQAENPIPAQYADIPSYFQLSYSNILYGDGTVETSGSSIVALAMVATYLTGYSYYPDDLSRWFAGKADNDIARLNYAAKALQLPFEVSQQWGGEEGTFSALKAGKLIVVQTDSKSVFGADSHFVVLKGMTEKGKILVNDPCISNLVDNDLKEKYTTGFEETDISNGFCYAWIFDTTNVPANVPYYTDPPAADKDRYASLKLTPAEKQLLARAVYANAYGECEEGQQMMAEVILNRMLSDEYPDDLKDIIYGEDGLCDVSLLNEAELTQTHYLVVERALFGPYQLKESVTDFSYVCHK